MANTLGFLKKSWQKFSDGHPISGFFVLLLLSVPFSLGFGNIALILFALASVLFLKQHRTFHVNFTLLIPATLFLLMCVSLIWSVDASRTLKAIPREIYFIAVPVCCMFFPGLASEEKRKVLHKYGYGMTAVCIFYLLKASLRYLQGATADVFFYHELVTEEVNAIHVSIYVSVAFFALLPKKRKAILDWICICILALLVVLLSSKNVILVFGLLILAYFAFFFSVSTRGKLIGFGALLFIALVPLLLFPNITDRFMVEVNSASGDGSTNETSNTVHNVSVSQAWNQERFNQNDYFPGTAFRVYQIRVFTELLERDQKYLTGYGLNASQTKIGERAREHNVFKGDGIRKGYQGKNFHNQYIQNFADLGIFGLILLCAMLFLTLKNGFSNKDFTHISFAVLMISLFLTESFLLRQRGVMFFTAMYCLLNAGAVAVAVKKE